jgi:P27 family predicted phage terminase small subunit
MEAPSPDLMDMGVLSRIDSAALAAYCECWSRWRDAERNIAKYGSVIRTPQGYPIQAPYIGMATEAIEQTSKFLSEFGMTPASRSRINGTAPAPDRGSGNDPYVFLA